MKILQVNKFLFPNGGADKYFLELSAQLTKNGHEVRFFSMSDPRNLPCSDEKYFVSHVSFTGGNIRNKFRLFARVMYSREARKKFTALLEDFKPDIIHLHNIYHQISPSIIRAANQAKIPVVMHLHDYKLVCPNYKLFTKNKVCFRCRKQKYYHCLKNKCLDNSFLKSFASTIEMYYHHKFLKIYEKGVNLFIAPSRFIRKTVESFGWPSDKIIFLPNFFKIEDDAKTECIEGGDYLLYFGRLAPEKGINVLLQAAKLTDSRIKIVGEGEEEEILKKMAAKLGIKKQVEFLGYKNGRELMDLIVKAKAVVIPSLWLENMPLNLLEALAYGQVVIASKIGGIPEIITDNENGYLFEPGNAFDLASKIDNLQNSDLKEIKIRAKKSVSKFDIVRHVKQLEDIYKRLIQTKNNRNKS